MRMDEYLARRNDQEAEQRRALQLSEADGKQKDAQIASDRATMDKAAPMLTDAQASTVVALYPVMTYNGLSIPAGTRINWEGELYRAAVALWDREDSDPVNAPSLWERIMYRDGVRIIPETITAGLAFGEGELGWWPEDGQVYRSKLAGNVWTPVQHAAGWEVTDHA